MKMTVQRALTSLLGLALPVIFGCANSVQEELGSIKEADDYAFFAYLDVEFPGIEYSIIQSRKTGNLAFTDLDVTDEVSGWDTTDFHYFGKGSETLSFARPVVLREGQKSWNFKGCSYEVVEVRERRWNSVRQEFEVIQTMCGSAPIAKRFIYSEREGLLAITIGLLESKDDEMDFQLRASFALVGQERGFGHAR